MATQAISKSVKFAVSLERPLFDQLDTLAHELHTPRSNLISDAIRQYLYRRETEEIARSWNEAYADGLDEDEQKTLDATLRMHAERLARTGD